MKRLIVTALAAAQLCCALGLYAQDIRPSWIDNPFSAREKYEPGKALSQWYYDVGISNQAASEQLARTRARQNIQQAAAANIASDLKVRLDITSFSTFSSSSTEDVEHRIEEALTNSIKTRIPRYEVLEWYIERGRGADQKDWYRAYVLVRFQRQDIITMVEKVDAEKFADAALALMDLLEWSAREEEKRKLIAELEEAKEYTVEELNTI